jgi:hypothetical protein
MNNANTRKDKTPKSSTGFTKGRKLNETTPKNSTSFTKDRKLNVMNLNVDKPRLGKRLAKAAEIEECVAHVVTK